MSHPSWVRGLKRSSDRNSYLSSAVAPLVGAWIETSLMSALDTMSSVAPLVGAWIETSRVRQQYSQEQVAPLVGAWIETSRVRQQYSQEQVAPLVGAWIETHIHLSSLYDNMILPLLYICFLKGTIMLFAGHICTISRHFYSISFYKNGLRKYPSPCCHFQISADV